MERTRVLLSRIKAFVHIRCGRILLCAKERFGGVDLPALCECLAQAGFLHRAGRHWHWTQEAYPADAVSLRAVTSDNFVIVDITEEPEVIGEVDFSSALTAVHPKAIYLHQGQQYHVERLDFDERKAYVKRVDVDYYTDAIRYTQVRVLESVREARIVEDSTGADRRATRSHGDVQVRSQVIGFKKIKFFTNENVGAGNLELPENEMHTTSFWLTLERPLVESLPFSISERQSGMFGLLYALESIATLLLMCDGRDLGTAIGDATAAAAKRLKAVKDSKSRIAIVLTDGDNNKGEIDPVPAAQLAAALGEKVYTIGIGIEEPCLLYAFEPATGKLLFDPQGNLIPTMTLQPANYSVLGKMAALSQAKFYRATSRRELQSIYNDIDRLEKTEVKLRRFTTYRPLFQWPLLAAFGLFTLEMLLSNTRLRRTP